MEASASAAVPGSKAHCNPPVFPLELEVARSIPGLNRQVGKQPMEACLMWPPAQDPVEHDHRKRVDQDHATLVDHRVRQARVTIVSGLDPLASAGEITSPSGNLASRPGDPDESGRTVHLAHAI
jgi:hypothetical protein